MQARCPCSRVPAVDNLADVARLPLTRANVTPGSLDRRNAFLFGAHQVWRLLQGKKRVRVSRGTPVWSARLSIGSQVLVVAAPNYASSCPVNYCRGTYPGTVLLFQLSCLHHSPHRHSRSKTITPLSIRQATFQAYTRCSSTGMFAMSISTCIP